MGKSKFYMLVGLPGSGKSYYTQNLKGAKVFSSDDIREELSGDINNQDINKQVFEVLHKRVIDCLKKGYDCVYDATNVVRKRRVDFLGKLSDIDCEKICVVILTDYDVCLFNNKARNRNVPEEVIKNMYLKFDIPQYREGWDSIEIYCRFSGEKNYDIRDTVETLRRIPHDNPKHTKTIGNHICAVTNDIVESCKKVLPVSELWRLQEVGFYHDIGKEFCKVFDKDNIAHYRGHENVSAYMYMLYKLFHEPMFDKEELLYRADLISLHMKPYDMDNLDDFIKELGEDKVMEMLIINKSDIKF